MKAALELRAEAERMRQFAKTVVDPEVRSSVNDMIAELECRARHLDEAEGTTK